MRIGELAALVGVSTRTVRHYHHQGVLPEPARRGNGYREYGLPDAIRLARARRLTELGLTLDEVRDVLAGDCARELREILLELDADLARQEEAIRSRRERLAVLLREESPQPDDAVSPGMAEVLRRLAPVRGAALTAPETSPRRSPESAADARTTPSPAETRDAAAPQAVFTQSGAARPASRTPGPPPVPETRTVPGPFATAEAFAASDAELLALLDSVAEPADRDRLLELMEPMLAPHAMARGQALYRRLAELGDADPADPRVGALAAEFAAHLPPGLAAMVGSAVPDTAHPFARAFLSGLAPAQAEAVRQALALLAEGAAR